MKQEEDMCYVLLFYKSIYFFRSKDLYFNEKRRRRHKAFVSNYKPQFFFRTANVTGTIILPENVSAVMQVIH